MDREKVIRGLHCCAHTDGANCIYCPYNITGEDCTAQMSMDVLDLLKEHEATWEYNPGGNVPYCSNCMMPQDMPTRYCHSCGAKMNYDGW